MAGDDDPAAKRPRIDGGGGGAAPVTAASFDSVDAAFIDAAATGQLTLVVKDELDIDIERCSLASHLVDAKLWEGAAAEGWRIVPRSTRATYFYVAPNGVKVINRAQAFAIRDGESPSTLGVASSPRVVRERRAAKPAAAERTGATSPPAKLPPDRSKAFAAAMCSARLGPAWSFGQQPRREEAERRRVEVTLDYVMAHTSHRPTAAHQAPNGGGPETNQADKEPEDKTAEGVDGKAGAVSGVGNGARAAGEAGAGAGGEARTEAGGNVRSESRGGTKALEGEGGAEGEGRGRGEGKGDGEGGEEGEEGDASSSLCGVLGCTRRHGHKGLCDVVVSGERGGRARRPPKWREMQMKNEGAAEEVVMQIEDADPPAQECGARGGRQSSFAPDAFEAEGPEDLECALPWTEASWGLLYASATKRAAALAAAAANAHGGGGGYGGGVGGGSVRWLPPPVGSSVYLSRSQAKYRVNWHVAVVASHSLRRGKPVFTVARKGDGVRLSEAGEGVAWRRLPLKKGETIEVPPAVRPHTALDGPPVGSWDNGPRRDARCARSMPCSPRSATHSQVEVEEEGEIVWRPAIVRKRHYQEKKVDDFTAVVCYEDGTCDEGFVERYSLQSEGVEWRRVSEGGGEDVGEHGR